MARRKHTSSLSVRVVPEARPISGSAPRYVIVIRRRRTVTPLPVSFRTKKQARKVARYLKEVLLEEHKEMTRLEIENLRYGTNATTAARLERR